MRADLGVGSALGTCVTLDGSRTSLDLLALAGLTSPSRGGGENAARHGLLAKVLVPTSGAAGCLQAPSRLLPPCLVQVWKYPKVWEGFIKCCQRTKPQSFQVILQLPPQQLGAVFDKCPELREPLLAHVRSFTPHQVPPGVGWVAPWVQPWGTEAGVRAGAPWQCHEGPGVWRVKDT